MKDVYEENLYLSSSMLLEFRGLFAKWHSFESEEYAFDNLKSLSKTLNRYSLLCRRGNEMQNLLVIARKNNVIYPFRKIDKKQLPGFDYRRLSEASQVSCSLYSREDLGIADEVSVWQRATGTPISFFFRIPDTRESEHCTASGICYDISCHPENVKSLAWLMLLHAGDIEELLS
jgi:hypothetical protein